MANIYIVDAGIAFMHSSGKLNHYLTQVAADTLQAMGHRVHTVAIDDGYEPQQEVEKMTWADSIIYQQPAWWMGGPWQLKKYIDEVFMQGAGVLFRDDGRTRSDATKKYGSGGLSQSKTYMLSATWNAPLEAFEDPKQFFEGKGIDGVYFPFHKAQEFIGMKALPSFMCNDVMKSPDIEGDVKRFQAHLRTHYAL